MLRPPARFPVSILADGVIKRLAAISRQQIFNVVGNRLEAMEGSAEVSVVGWCCGGCRVHARRGLVDGVCDHEVASNLKRHRREGSVGGFLVVGRHLHNASLCRLHHGRVLDDVGMDVVDTVVVELADSIDAGVECAVYLLANDLSGV